LKRAKGIKSGPKGIESGPKRVESCLKRVDSCLKGVGSWHSRHSLLVAFVRHRLEWQ
jgi:hypothetical protein